MNTSTRRLIAVLVFSSMALASCSRAKLPTARSGITETEAQAELEQRLLLSSEVSGHLKAIRKAIEPIEAVLRDLDKALGKAMDLRIDGHPGGALSGLLDRLDHALREAGRGIVQKRDDGSWIIERPSPLALLAGQQGSCARSRVRAVGDHLNGAEKITISMSDCLKPDQFEPLATMILRTNGDRDLEIFTPVFEGRRTETINIEPCRLRIEPKGHTELTCSSPITLESKDFLTVIERLDVRGDIRSLQADIRARIRHADRWARVTIEPNRPVELRVCARGEPCVQ